MIFAMIQIYCLLIWAVCVAYVSPKSTTGTYAEVKYFDKIYVPDRISNNGVVTRSLVSCASECHQRGCTNLIYNEELRDCIINEGFISFPPETVFKVIADMTFVEFDQFSWAIGAPPTVSCISNEDCLSDYSINSMCTEGLCSCSACYTYTNSACEVGKCADYDDDFDLYPSHVLDTAWTNNIESKGVTLQYCKDACLTGLNFDCLSFDYRPLDGYCRLSRSSKCAPLDSLKSNDFFAHYHRKCKNFS